MEAGLDIEINALEVRNDILAIGQPIMDMIATVDGEFLRKYNLQTNSAVIATQQHEQLFRDIQPNYEPGGSIYNTLIIIQRLVKTTTTFIGCVGNDLYGEILKNEGIKNGINIIFEKVPQATSTCAVLITNNHRTLCTKIGAGNYFSNYHLKKHWKYIQRAKYFYIVGFFMSVNPPCVMEIARHSHVHNKRFIMNLSAEFICIKYKREFMDVFPYIDVIFGNQSEAQAFSRAHNLSGEYLKDICLEISKLPKKNDERGRIVVITQGADPVIVALDGIVREFQVVNVPEEDIIDTNGAGDAFVGGFLAEYIQGKDVDVCIEGGIRAATESIQTKNCK